MSNAAGAATTDFMRQQWAEQANTPPQSLHLEFSLSTNDKLADIQKNNGCNHIVRVMYNDRRANSYMSVRSA